MKTFHFHDFYHFSAINNCYAQCQKLHIEVTSVEDNYFDKAAQNKHLNKLISII